MRTTPVPAYGLRPFLEPVAGLVQASDGNFYGTCLGGPYSFGMTFRLSIPVAPVLQQPQKTSGGFMFKWSAVVGQTYQVQYKTDLTANLWNDVGTPAAATNGVMSATDSAPPGPTRFYRVVLLP